MSILKLGSGIFAPSSIPVIEDHDFLSVLQQARIATTPPLPSDLEGPVLVVEVPSNVEVLSSGGASPASNISSNDENLTPSTIADGDLIKKLDIPDSKLPCQESIQYDLKTLDCSINDDIKELKSLFPHTWNQPLLSIQPDPNPNAWITHPLLRVGIVLSGGQAPGGHNVVAGVYDYIKKCNPNSQLFGFLMGPLGIFEHNYVEVTDNLMNTYRNMGGFDMLKSGRHKIETEQQKMQSVEITKKLDLHGLVIVGGDDSNTNAAVLAEYFKANNSPTKVVGVPKTIDGDLRNEYIETSFGFDTAVKTYAEFVGNLAADLGTSGKYYHFIRLMGRSASNITLQCSLLTRPNLTFIGEEIQEKKSTLKDLVNEIVEMFIKRQDLGKDHGLVLLPEGLIEFIPEVGCLIQEINSIFVGGEFESSKLSPESLSVFESLPPSIRSQLLLDRDPHGNVQVSRIATEKLLILMTKEALKKLGRCEKFVPRSHFFGYEGRSGMPSVFDGKYCYALGHCAAALVDSGKTGYMAVIRQLDQPSSEWKAGGCPLTRMLNMEIRKGKSVPVIKKYLIELDQEPFTMFKEVRDIWKVEDLYCCPGPIQFEGPTADLVNYSVKMPTKQDLLPERGFGFEQLKQRHFFPKSLSQLSPLQVQRLKAPIAFPPVLSDETAMLIESRTLPFNDPQLQSAVISSFPLLCREARAKAYRCVTPSNNIMAKLGPLPTAPKVLRIGVLLNGQQSPGVSNILVGLWERLRIEATGGRLIGFQNGVEGLLASPPKYIEISRDDLALCRNQGGFELLGRAKESEMEVVTDKGLNGVCTVCTDMNLDGLVLIGGRYTITNVAVVAEEFLARSIKTKVVGVPATQNNNINSGLIESCIGFDSASKCYNHLIGNLNTDSSSSAKYWVFIRLMGADKSQIAVESALATHPNVVIVSEAYAAGDKTLQDVVSYITDVVVARSSAGLHFGSVIIPEGLIAALPQFRQLLTELRTILSSLQPSEVLSVVDAFVKFRPNDSETNRLSPWGKALLKSLPEYFRQQLVQPRSFGSLELTKISTEELLADLVTEELNRRERLGLTAKFSFVPLCFYFGYQGRCSLPSKFDCSLGFSHGSLAAVAIKSGRSGYITSIRGLSDAPVRWIPAIYPATAFLKLQSMSTDQDSYPRKVPMVPSEMVVLNSKVYQKLLTKQQRWEMEDHYCNPGPLQFEGPASSIANHTLYAEHRVYLEMLSNVHKSIGIIRHMLSGASDQLLFTSVGMLSIIKQLHQHEDL